MYQSISSNKGAPDSAVTVLLDGNSSGVAGNSTPSGYIYPNHQFAIDQGDSTVGTITVTAIAVGKTVAEPVFEDDGLTALVIDLSVANEPLTRSIENNSLESIIFTGAGMDGSEEFKVTIVSGG